MAGQHTISAVVAADARPFKKGMTQAASSTSVLTKSLKNVAVVATAAFAAASFAAVDFGTKAIKAASDLAETSSKTNVIFGKSAESLKKFATTTADSLGQTQTQFLDAAATFGIFGKAAKLTNAQNVKFSTTLAKLASDLASFNNTSVDDAITSIGAALRGESEPIRKYGVLLNDATLKAQAFADGTYSGKGVLDQSARVLAAYKVILKQTTLQQGDFNRTQDGFANASRRVAALWSELQITVGNKLLPVLIDLLPGIVDQLKKLTVDPEFNKSIESFAKAIKDVLPDLIDALPSLIDFLKIVSGVLGQIAKAITDIKNAFNFGDTSKAGPVWENLYKNTNPFAPGVGKSTGPIGGTSKTTVNINVNAVSSSAETGKAVANALATYYRSGGKQVK